MFALPPRASWTELMQRSFGRRSRLPSARMLITIAAIVVTAVLILEWGIWYFAGLIILYAALDVVQRMEERRDAGTMVAILRTAGRKARAVVYVGSARQCRRAAWIAREHGWIVRPLVRGRFRRHSIRFVPGSGAAQVSALLQSLHRGGLVTRLRLPDYLPKCTPGRAERGLGPGWTA